MKFRWTNIISTYAGLHTNHGYTTIQIPRLHCLIVEVYS